VVKGFSIPEVLVVTVVMGLIAAIAYPLLSRARARVDVSAAREAFSSSHSLARQVAAQYGRLCRLHLDPNENRFWVTVDTSTVPGLQRLDTVRPIVDVGRQFGGVRVEGRQMTFCFDPHARATARSDCDLPNATVVFRLRSVTDTVTISRLGRLRRR
jgi:prepilin-type N-terminal cleavage/methylation domain-containing protein